jgi:CRISPR-associated protein Cas2
MTRRRYLIAYDISEPKRLRRIIKIMEGAGQRLQYSVFLCDLSGMELAEWDAAIRAVVQLTEDSIVRIDLGSSDDPARVWTMGTPRAFPTSGPLII